MNINELSGKLNISVDTIKRWEAHFKFEINKDIRGHKHYSEADLKMFHAIKLLRDNEKEMFAGSRNSQPQINLVNDIHSLNFLIKEIRVLLENRLTTILEISDKYSKTSYELGHLQAQLDTKEQVLNLICETYNKVINSLKKDIEKKNKEIEDLNLEKDKEIGLLRAELAKERNKPWWARIIRNN